MPAELVHKELLLPKLAVYASPENLTKYSNIVIPEDTAQYSSDVTQRQIPVVSKLVVPIVMSGDTSREQWTVEPWHIRIALRTYAGVYLENEECVSMPEKRITGPNSRYNIKTTKSISCSSSHVPGAEYGMC